MFFAFFTWLQWICPPVFFKSYNPHWYVVGFLFPLWRNIRVSSRFSPPVSLLTPPNLLLLFPINFYVFFVILPLLTPYSFTRLLILHLERVKERGQASFFFWIFPVNVDCCFFFFLISQWYCTMVPLSSFLLVLILSDYHWKIFRFDECQFASIAIRNSKKTRGIAFLLGFFDHGFILIRLLCYYFCFL